MWKVIVLVLTIVALFTRTRGKIGEAPEGKEEETEKRK